jgi:hypothetical protein
VRPRVGRCVVGGGRVRTRQARPVKKAMWTDPFGTKVRRQQEAEPEHEDPLNPAFPKAPLVPRDFAKMINAALPKWSKPPAARPGDARAYSAHAETTSRSPHQHVDAHPPPGATPSTYESAAMPPHSDPFEPGEPASGRVPAISSGAARREGRSGALPAGPAHAVQGRGQWQRAGWPIALLIALAVAIWGGMWLASMLH